MKMKTGLRSWLSVRMISLSFERFPMRIIRIITLAKESVLKFLTF